MQILVHNDAVLVDQERTMPKSGSCFIDVCHLNRFGMEIFVLGLVGALEAEIAFDREPPGDPMAPGEP